MYINSNYLLLKEFQLHTNINSIHNNDTNFKSNNKLQSSLKMKLKMIILFYILSCWKNNKQKEIQNKPENNDIDYRTEHKDIIY